MQQHERQQAPHLRLGAGQGELTGEADRLRGQVDPSGVTGGVDEVEDAKHDGDVGRPVEASVVHGALGAADPLRHRGLRHQEGVGDLTGGEAADRAQGERDGRGRGQVRVRAQEEQEQAVVPLPDRSGRRLVVDGLLPLPASGLAAARVHEPAGRHGGEPGSRVARWMARPDPQRLDQRLLQAVLGCGEVVAAPHQGGQHLRDEGPEQALVHRVRLGGHRSAQSPSELTPDITSRTWIHS